MAGIQALEEVFDHVVIVSNDVFLDGSEYDSSMQDYLCNLAQINRQIAQSADLVVEVVCSIPIYQKGDKLDEKCME